MSKSSQAPVLRHEQLAHLLNAIQEHRYPEKNTVLIQISFKLGLRVQEIALLQIKDLAEPVSLSCRLVMPPHQAHPLSN
jgi:integrase